MPTKRWALAALLSMLLTLPAIAQESVRQLEGPGEKTKFLTHNQMDRWQFSGQKGEAVIVFIASGEFDPILSLAEGHGEDGKPLVEVDDDGSEARFAIRLPAAGKYEIRVNAFKFQGGGNYRLRVQRFQPQALKLGEPALAALSREGAGYFYFHAEQDQILLPEVRGAASWKVLNPQGEELTTWGGSVRTEAAGEHYLLISGEAGFRYGVTLSPATRRELLLNKELDGGQLRPGEMHVWSIEGEPGDFRVFEVEKRGEFHARLIHAPVEEQASSPLESPRPELQFLPIASRGGHLRFAAILGRSGRFELQLLARTAASYQVSVRDPSVALNWGDDAQGTLPVTATAFYRFEAASGELLEAELASEDFAPALTLYDAQGEQVARGSEGGDALVAGIQQMVTEAGPYLLSVGSVGDGGGGDFTLSLEKAALKQLEIDARAAGEVTARGVEFWSFTAPVDKTIILHVRSDNFQPSVTLRSPTGVVLARAQSDNAETGVLLAVKLPTAGDYTIWVSPQSGAGKYEIRLIDGD